MIDGGLTDEWPPEVIEATDRFQQGDLIESPPIAYAASLRFPVWGLTRLEAESREDDPGLEYLGVHEDDSPPYGIILEQTCDIAEDRPSPLIPWIEIAPVYLCDEGDSLLGRDYIYPLLSFTAPEKKCWVADLRLRPSLEKSVLVGRKPVDPFNGSEKERIDFGVALGTRIARAALAESIHTVIEGTIDTHKPRKTGKRVGTRVYKLMIQVEEGTRLEPQSVRLHVISHESPAAKIDEQGMREWFGSWYDEAVLVAEAHGIILQTTFFHDAASMDLALYDRLVEIRCPLH